MSEAAVLEAPVISSPQSQPDIGSLPLAEAMKLDIAARKASPDGGMVEQAPQAPQRQQAQPQQQSSQAAAQEVQSDASAETKIEAKPSSKLDKFGKPAEEAKPLTTEEFGDTVPAGEKAQNAWTTIKKQVKEYQAKEQAWAKQQAEWEAKVKEYESRQSDFSEEDRNALTKYREAEAIDYVTKTTEYVEKAQTPFNQGKSVLMEVSEYTGIPLQKIEESLMEPNSILRDENILTLMETSSKEITEARKEALKNRVIEAGDKMNDAVAEHRRLTEDAATKKQQRETAMQAEAMKSKQEAEKVFRSAMAETGDGLKVQLKDLIEQGLLSEKDIDSVAQEKFTDDPMERAIETYITHVSVPLIKNLRQEMARLKAENEQYKADRQARMKAQPGVKPSSSSSNGKAPEMSLTEAMKAHISQSRNGAGMFGG